MASIITEAIVVRLVDYGEADRVATLYTRSAGKLSALARGVRRSRRRFAGIELFAVGEATLKRRNGELWWLDAFHARRGWPAIGMDVTKVAHAAYVTEVTRELSAAEATDERVYGLLEQTLALIDGGGCDPAALRSFELRLLGLSGFEPSLGRCVGCGGPPSDDERQLLEVRHGGVLCSACAPSVAMADNLGAGGLRPLPGAVRQALAAAQLGEAIRLPPSLALLAREATLALLLPHLPGGRPLRSLEFIAKLNAGLASANFDER